MKRILCFGDSNTWGYIPNGHHTQYDENTRFSMVLQKLLGSNYKIIENGLPGRCAINDDPTYNDVNFNGSKIFLDVINDNLPIDYLILYIGSNDMKDFFSMNAEEVAKGIFDKYITPLAKISPNTRIILISPKVINKPAFFGFIEAYNKSKDFDKYYLDIAKKSNTLFLSTNNLPVGDDGLHLTKKAHLQLANELKDLIISN